MLAQRTSLAPNLDGNDIQSGFQKSGLFLEASLASGSVSQATGIPDLKAALIVLRQTLVTSLGTTEIPVVTSLGATESPAVTVLQSTAPQSPVPGAPTAPASEAASAQTQTTQQAPPLAPSSPEVDVQEILLPQARLPIAAETLDTGRAERIVLTGALLATEPRSTTSGAVLNLLQEALQENPPAPGNASSATVTLPNGQSEEAIIRTNTPPPPFRGACRRRSRLPRRRSRPMRRSRRRRNICSKTPMPRSRARRCCRWHHCPIAPMPRDARLDPSTPRWSFEIPFATPQGTAMAQFEISRDGGGTEADTTTAKRVWRARFSLDVEPAGPVHALISLTGERTSVRMWAERPATAAQLRAGAAELSQALSKAELQPGDIVIRAGTPPQVTPARAGHFLDRATMSGKTKSQLAVALHYDRNGAPRVIAKGKGTIGEKIIEVAKAHDIPIEENEVLAGALSNVELGDEIPAELYKAVAEVLIFVLRLSRPPRQS